MPLKQRAGNRLTELRARAGRGARSSLCDGGAHTQRNIAIATSSGFHVVLLGRARGIVSVHGQVVLAFVVQARACHLQSKVIMTQVCCRHSMADCNEEILHRYNHCTSFLRVVLKWQLSSSSPA